MDPIIGAETDAERDAATARGLRIFWRIVLPLIVFFALLWVYVRWLIGPVLTVFAIVFLAWRARRAPILRELLQKAQRFARKFAIGISSIIPNRKPAPAIRKSRIVARETRNPGQRATLHLTDVGERNQFWTGAIAFARAFANFPILWVIAAVLFGLAWGQWNRVDGVREGRLKERALWQAAQLEAAKRGARAQTRLDSNVKEREAEHEETRIVVRTIVQQSHEEIDAAPDIDAAYAAYLRACAELRERAETSAADAYSDFASSVVR